MQVFKNIKEGVTIGLSLLAGAIVLLVMSPLIVVYYLATRIAEVKHKKNYKKFIAQQEGAQFFVYTNRQTTQSYVEEHLLQQLPQGLHIILLRDTVPVSTLPTMPVSHLLNACAAKGGMPYIITISNSQPVATSVNNQLYAAIQHNDPKRVLQRISELTGGKVGATGD